MSEFLRKVVLKSCPFCGGKAELVKTLKGYESRDGAITDVFKVRCPNCFVGTESQRSDIRINKNGFLEVRRNGAEEAIRIWNRRTDFDLITFHESEEK